MKRLLIAMVFFLILPGTLAEISTVDKAPKKYDFTMPILCGYHSMGNLISCHDRIYGVYWWKTNISIGDIIAFNNGPRPGTYTVHRVTDMGYDDKGLFYLTKGDNNTVGDGVKVRNSLIKGKITAVKKPGSR